MVAGEYCKCYTCIATPWTTLVPYGSWRVLQHGHVLHMYRHTCYTCIATPWTGWCPSLPYGMLVLHYHWYQWYSSTTLHSVSGSNSSSIEEKRGRFSSMEEAHDLVGVIFWLNGPESGGTGSLGDAWGHTSALQKRYLLVGVSTLPTFRQYSYRWYRHSARLC